MRYLSLILFLALPVLSFAGSGELQIIPNLGQWEQSFLYKFGNANFDIYLENGQITYMLGDPANGDKMHDYFHHPATSPVLKYHAYRMIFEGANLNAETKGTDPITLYYNYYFGNDPDKWKTGIHPFTSVTYTALYPGIDALIRSDEGNFAYDFIVAPDADVAQIKLKFEGVDRLELREGKLLLYNSIKTVEESVPYTYQIVNGVKTEVKSMYVLDGNTVSFAFPDGYDKGLPLVIDPSVVFVTFSGSNVSNWGFSATYDEQGNAYGGGMAWGVGYPVTLGAIQTVYGGANDMSITKFSPDGSQQLYATYLGGNGLENVHSMIVDASGNLLIAGKTSAADYPVTPGCYGNTYNGGAYDLVVSKFNSSGTVLLASTYVGGSGADGNNAAPFNTNWGDNSRGEIMCDNAGNVYVSSNTKSVDFPTMNATQNTLTGTMNGVAFKLNSNLSSLLWSTYFGGNVSDIATSIALSNNESYVYISGGTASANLPTTTGAYMPTYQGGSSDGFIARFQNGGSFALTNCTYIGSGAFDESFGLQVDRYNGVYAMGQTYGNFPLAGSVYSNPGSAHFIIKLDSVLNNVQFSTVFGNGTTNDLSPTAFMVDSCLNIYFSGWGNPPDMPYTNDAFQTAPLGSTDFYFLVLSANAGSLLFASYFGSTGYDHVDGGTSRFDRRGVIYQGMCSGGITFPNMGTGLYTINIAGYDNVTMKVDLDLAELSASANTNDTSGCGPLTVQFQNTSNNATSYLWDFGDGSPVDTAADPLHVFIDPGVYNVMLVANSSYICNSSDTLYITVTVDPNTIESDFSYQIVDSCGPYTATFTNLSTAASATATYIWDFGDNTTYAGETPPLHTFPDTGIYTVTLVMYDTAAVCSNYDTVSYTISFTTFDVVVDATPSPDSRGCAPFTVQFQNNTFGADIYLWDLGDGSANSSLPAPSHTYTTSGIYTVMLIATNTTPSVCKNIDTGYITIIVDTGEVSANFTAIVTDSCDPGPYNVSIINTSPYASSTTVFTWDFGDGSTYTGQYPVQHIYSGQGTYTITLVVEDSLSCNKIDSVSKTITISSFVAEAVMLTLPESCTIYDIPFSHQSSNAQSVFWSLGDGTTSIQNSFTHRYNTTGEYSVLFIASHPLSCNGNDTISGIIKVKQSAVADFVIVPEVPIQNEPIHFENQSQYADTYLWDFGDGETSEEEHPSKLYLTSDTFNVCLTANNQFNCPDTICRTAYSDIKPIIDLPTGFSPNGDGKNDILYVRGVGIVTVNLKIFNRWGTLIFESNSMDVGWDGKFRDREQPMEVYGYLLYATFVDGSSYQKQGNVTLIR